MSFDRSLQKTAVVVLCDEDLLCTVYFDDKKETKKIKNPLSVYPSFEKLSKKYAADPKGISALLTDAVLQTATSVLSSMDLSSVDETVVAGKGLYLKILLGMKLPEELKNDFSALETKIFGSLCSTVRFVPILNDFVGGEVLAETTKLKEKSLLIDCEKTATLFLIGEKNNLAAAVWDCGYDEIGLRCIRAAAKYFAHEEKFSTIYLYGKRLRAVEDELDEDFACIRKEKSPDSVVEILSTNGLSRVKKEIARTTYLYLYDREVFQRYLTE